MAQPFALETEQEKTTAKQIDEAARISAGMSADAWENMKARASREAEPPQVMPGVAGGMGQNLFSEILLGLLSSGYPKPAAAMALPAGGNAVKVSQQKDALRRALGEVGSTQTRSNLGPPARYAGPTGGPGRTAGMGTMKARPVDINAQYPTQQRRAREESVWQSRQAQKSQTYQAALERNRMILEARLKAEEEARQRQFLNSLLRGGGNQQVSTQEEWLPVAGSPKKYQTTSTRTLTPAEIFGGLF